MHMNQEEFRSHLKTALTNSIMKITFMKKDGSERVMKCTLKEEFLPPKTESNKQRKENYSVISVFDVDIKEWRSIILDNIVEFEQEAV